MTATHGFCLGTEVPRRSAGIDRLIMTVDETESTQVRMRLCKMSSHKTRPAPTINPHLIRCYSAGHLLARTPSTARAKTSGQVGERAIRKQ